MGARVFAGNAFWMLASDLVSKVASFVLVVILARGLGAEQYGYFNFAVSFVPIFLVVGSLGVDVGVIRDVARNRDRVSRVFASGLTLRAGFGVIALVLSGAIGLIVLDQRQALVALLVVGAALFLDEMSRFTGTVFKAFERMRLHAFVVLVNRVLSTALAGVALAAGGGLAVIAGAYLVGSLGALLFAWIALRRYFPPIHLRDAARDEMKALLKQGVHVGVASTVNMLTFRLDAVLLGILRGPISVAMYGVAYRFFESFLFVSWSLSNVVLPRIARADRGEEASVPFQMALGLTLIAYLPLAAGAPFAADWVVTTLFSDRYANAAPAVMWLTGALVFYGIAYLARMATIGLGHRKGIAQIALAALVINAGLNIALIPNYGFMAAAVVTFATEVLEAALLLIAFLKAAHSVRLQGFVLVPVAAAGAMAGVLAIAGAEGPTAIALGGGVYLAGLAASAFVFAPSQTKRALRMVRRPRLTAGASADS